MTVKRKAAPKPPAANWQSAGSPHELQGADVIAHGIVTDRPDLMPSVARIMKAELDTDARIRAITLFRNALSNPGDVHRDPRVAIERCVAK